ncbi:hypothetical protein EDB87DRAFT_1778590 [Lactarius vividus]|nr:hypothetical protein EDB87DRAFT_1778590 [Lactarius vividus]
MIVQSLLVAECELRNMRTREDVAKGYHDVSWLSALLYINVRGIRVMGFEGVFRERFNDSTEHALHMGVRGAFVEGCAYDVALLFYPGMVLVSQGTYTYLQVLNLVGFTVSIGSQLMAFSYPERPDAPVLRDFSLDMLEGESSTMAYLLQRLYEAGTIIIGPWSLHGMDTCATTFWSSDATVSENIAYGTDGLLQSHIQRAALIARGLVRPGDVLTLGECTSALDGASPAAVPETVPGAKAVMRMCDRIVMLEGRAAEQGTYDQLVARIGVFAQLASGGEWSVLRHN